MSAQELLVWGMALGAIASVAMARTADLIVRPTLSQYQGVAYHITVLILVMVMSEVPEQAGLRINPRYGHIAQVLAGPVCVGLANFWIRGWLNASQRDQVMSGALRAAALLLPLIGLGCLALPQAQQIPVAAGFSLLGTVITFWLSVRAWLLGDPLAHLMAVGCFFMIAAIAGLHALAMNLPGMSVAVQAAIALCAVLANGITGFVLWRRDRHEWKARQRDKAPSQFDPVTKLQSGIGLVQKLIKAQRRRRRSRRDGAVIAILVFDVERLIPQIGTAGVNEVFIAIASRIQRQVGVVNTVGRYYDRCFVSLVETIQSPMWLRTLGLRVASSLRRPIEVTAAGGERVEVRVDIGVGVVHLSGGPEPVEDILHDAQRMAEAARDVPSRAAMLDPSTGEVVGVEQANLGPRRHRPAHGVPHAF